MEDEEGQAVPDADEIFEEEEGEEIAAPAAGSRSPWFTTALVGILALALGLFLGYVGRGQYGPEAQAARGTASAVAVLEQTQAAGNQELLKYLTEQTRHFKGDASAPVVLIEFSDFQCPYCGVFVSEVGRLLDEKYVNTGKVRFGYWNFAFLGEESQWAAEASECAADQDKYWEMHDKLFASQKGENQNAFSKDNLKKIAADMSLDTAAFKQCLDSGKYTQQVQSDTAIAQRIGVQSTPSFLINGQPLVGAQPFEKFQEIIDRGLK